ncbi:phospholipase D/nuclease [Venturia nashicola]|nr:phospholipase D/nuclease [Venturia nashicola]
MSGSSTESDDEDLKRAIAMSLEEDAKSSPVKSAVPMDIKGKATKSYGTKPAQVAPGATANTARTGIMGLDRASMEAERLARLASRKRPAHVHPSGVELEDLAASKKPKIETSANYASAISTPTNASTLHYPRGVVKRTWSKLHPRDNDIKIEEILMKDKLKIAVLSSFQWDQDWIFSKINLKTTRMIVVMEAKNDAERVRFTKDAEDVGLKACCPPQQGQYTCMHSKLMLLFYEESLRIVIPTANLMRYDWGETGIMENSAFIVDLPRRKDGTSSQDGLTFFGKELMYFLEKQGVQENARHGVLKFDFSDTKHLAFVHSSFGSHFGEDLRRNGLPGLSRAIKHLGLDCEGPFELDFAASSIGSLTDLPVNTLYEAARGRDIIAQGRDKLKIPNSQTKQHFRIYFPLHETVANSLGGTNSGGTICLQKRYFEKPDFPEPMFRDSQSKRQGMLSHNKILLARGRKSTSDESKETVAWAYIGSANMSESAWGRIVMDRATKSPKLTCNNWECGVLISVSNPPSNVLEESLDTVFKDVLDIPFVTPANEYQGKKPWYFQEH